MQMSRILLVESGLGGLASAAVPASEPGLRCRFVPLVFGLFSSPSEALQASAVDVLTEIVGKRMEPVLKLGLVQQLNIAPVCARWRDTLPGAQPSSRVCDWGAARGLRPCT